MEKHEHENVRIAIVLVAVALVAGLLALALVYGGYLSDLDSRISALETPVAEREK